MKKIIPFFLITCLLILIGYFSSAQHSSSNIYKEVLEETNTFRIANGLAPLVSRSELNKLAQQHSDDMAEGRVTFGHEGFKERQKEALEQIITLKLFAENVALGSPTGKQAVEGWEKSPGHRKNLLGDFKYIGIGVALDKNGKLYYTQLFAG